nr:YlmH/Sll1252 family protein [uncultured Solibaculum sp.]
MGASKHSLEDQQLEARVLDAIRLSERRKSPCFVGFLDERQAVLARATARQFGCAFFLCWGGYQEAERTVFGVFPNQPDVGDFPIEPVTLRFRKQDSLSHRDFLGSLMALGIKREVIGDILVEEGRCVLFVLREMAEYITSQVEKVGRVGVKCFLGLEGELPAGHRVEPKEGVVASSRLDCVVAFAANGSRSTAVKMIQGGLVSVNHEVCTNVSYTVKEEDKLSIRGWGRGIIAQFGPPTRKGRLHILLNKYC